MLWKQGRDDKIDRYTYISDKQEGNIENVSKHNLKKVIYFGFSGWNIVCGSEPGNPYCCKFTLKIFNIPAENFDYRFLCI